MSVETLAGPAVETLTGPIGRLVGRAIWKSAAIGLFALLWEFGPKYLLDPSTRVFLPPLHKDLQAWWHLAQSGALQDHLQASLSRSAVGFGLAILAAVPLGLLIAWYRPVADFLNPLLELFRNTAALALLPVFPVLLNTIAGVKTVDPLLIRAARTLGLNSPRMFAKVILPAAVPTIFTGIRMAGAASILVLIAAEMAGAKAGLGYLITNDQNSFLYPEMYAGILTIAGLGLVINLVLVRLERHFSRWRTASASR